MPKSYDMSRLKVTHDPNQRVDTSPGQFPEINPIDVAAQAVKFFLTYGLDALKKVTGIDLTKLLAILNVFTSLFGINLSDLDSTDGPVPNLATFWTNIANNFLNPLKIFASVADLVNGVLTQTVGVISNPISQFLSAILGFGNNVIPAYTPANSAISALQGQVNAQSGANTGGTPMFDGFNTGPSLSASWVTICGTGAPVTAGGYVFSQYNFECYRYDADRPQTAFWQVQASVAFSPGAGGGGARIFGGADATLSTRYPAIEYIPSGASYAIRLVSLAGTPNTPGNANLGRIQHAEYLVGVFTIKTGDVLALEVNEATGVYNVYLNPGPGSTPICHYDDSTANLIPRGVGHRDGGLQLNLSNDSGFPGNGWDNYSCFNRAT